MKIEFLDDISAGGKFPHADPNQLVRLFDFDSSQVDYLRQSIQTNIIEGKNSLELSKLSFIDPINCNLTLNISVFDEGITTSNKIDFICSLTIEAYKNMVYLLEPFCDGNINGYQWLYDLNTAIDFLISPGGGW